MKPADTDTTVYVAMARAFLPRLHEWSNPVRLKVVEEKDGVVSLLLQPVEGGAA